MPSARGTSVATALNQDVQHHPGLVDRAPQPVLHACDRQHNLVQAPFVSSRGQPAANLVRERLAELQRPLAHGFMTNNDAMRGQRFIRHAQAEREAEVEPDGVADDLGRTAIAGVAGASRCRYPARLISFRSSREPASSQAGGAFNQPSNPTETGFRDFISRITTSVLKLRIRSSAKTRRWASSSKPSMSHATIMTARSKSPVTCHAPATSGPPVAFASSPGWCEHLHAQV